MFRFARVAGFAAAALAVALFPSLADPSLAFESGAPQEAVYTEHAAANVGAASIEDTIESIAPRPQPMVEPVVQHAIARLDDSDEDDRESLRGRPLAELVAEYRDEDADSGDIECLAGAIYFESKGEPLAGQLAVAEVIINRAKSGRYPKSICGVVTQRGQFSFVRGGRIPDINEESAAYRKAVAIAHIAVQDLADSPASNAMAFHATRVSPGWRMKRVARVGNHIFYR